MVGKQARNCVTSCRRQTVVSVWLVENVRAVRCLKAQVDVKSIAATIAEGAPQKGHSQSLRSSLLTAQQTQQKSVIDSGNWIRVMHCEFELR